MEVIFEEFIDLSANQIQDIFRLRQQVFVLEQQCLYEDIDGFDNQAEHLLFYRQKTLAAYLRLFRKGIKYEHDSSLGRIVVAQDFRGKDIGINLIKKGIELCGNTNIRIEAQAQLRNYYRQFGFKEEGSIYVVDGIDHLQMVLRGEKS